MLFVCGLYILIRLVIQGDIEELTILDSLRKGIKAIEAAFGSHFGDRVSRAELSAAVPPVRSWFQWQPAGLGGLSVLKSPLYSSSLKQYSRLLSLPELVGACGRGKDRLGEFVYLYDTYQHLDPRPGKRIQLR